MYTCRRLQRNIILSSIFVLFRKKKLFWPVIDVRHREKLKQWENFFIKSDMGGSKFIKGFQKLTCTHAGGFNGTLFCLRFLCFSVKKLFWPVIDVRHREKLKHWGKFFIKSEMGGSNFTKGFQKLTCTHAGGFNGTLFWL